MINDLFLLDASRRIILENQNADGAYIASPDFPTYKYCWLRDGSFIAYSMIITGELESAAAFLQWTAKAIEGQRDKISQVISHFQAGQPVSPSSMPPTRYNLDGTFTDEDWPNFQIDGYGTYLWCISEYLAKTGSLQFSVDLADTITLVIEYLIQVWREPNYDCWEENGDKINPSTLACVYSGLAEIGRVMENRKAVAVAEEIRSFVLERTVDGHFPKYLGTEQIDASLLWLALPSKLVAVDDARMIKTVSLIESRVLVNGVKRYPEDTYYGGGEWILLTAWLAWYKAVTGKKEDAKRLLDWISCQASSDGALPEQISVHLNDDAFLPQWEARWGKSARTLLWSSAMYLVASHALAE